MIIKCIIIMVASLQLNINNQDLLNKFIYFKIKSFLKELRCLRCKFYKSLNIFGENSLPKTSESRFFTKRLGLSDLSIL